MADTSTVDAPPTALEAVTQAAASLGVSETATSEFDSATAAEGPATTAPAVDGTTAPTATATTPQGPIPFDVHHVALANARTKAVEAYRQEHGWREGIDRQDWEAKQAWYARIGQDPVGFWQSVTEELQAHPQFAPQIRSAAAKLLAAARSQAAQDAEPSPDLTVDVVNDQGQVVGQKETYSAERQRAWHAWSQRQFDAKVAERFKPYDEERATRAQRDAQAQAWSEANTTAAQQITEAQSWHGFDEHRAAIKQAMATNPSWSMERAYIEIVLPSLPQRAQAQVVAQMKTKAAASTHDPGAATATASQKPRDVKGLAQFLKGRFGGAS